MTMEVLFASVPVADLRSAMRWYEQVFGRPADLAPNENEAMWHVAGSGWLYVIEDLERAGMTEVAISVDDLGQFIADLADRGITSGPIEAVGDAGSRSQVTDGDGNVFNWIQVATTS